MRVIVACLSVCGAVRFLTVTGGESRERESECLILFLNIICSKHISSPDLSNFQCKHLVLT